MSTELQRQVGALKAQQIASEPIQKGKASLFLSPKDAAGVDVDEIYDSSFQALQFLQQLDHRFSQYKSSLFHPSSVHLRRELKTSLENESLNKQINEFLKLLTVFVEHKQSHQILEYLIRRYRIHELNVDGYITCLLPIHDTKIFARAIQIIALPKNSVWSFLEGVRATGSPLPRNILIRECISTQYDLLSRITLSLLTSITLGLPTSVNTVIPRNSSSKTLSSKNSPEIVAVTNNVSETIKKLIDFYTALIIELISTITTMNQSLQDYHIRMISTYLLPGIQSYIRYYPQSLTPNSICHIWRKSCIVILLSMSNHTTFANTFMEFITQITIETYQKSLQEESNLLLDDPIIIDDENGDMSPSTPRSMSLNITIDMESVHFQAIQFLIQLSLKQQLHPSIDSVRILIEHGESLKSILVYLHHHNVSIEPFLTQFSRDTLSILLTKLYKSSNGNTEITHTNISTGNKKDISEFPMTLIQDLFHQFTIKNLFSSTLIHHSITQILNTLIQLKSFVYTGSTNADSTNVTLKIIYGILIDFSRMYPEIFDETVLQVQTTLDTDQVYLEALNRTVNTKEIPSIHSPTNAMQTDRDISLPLQLLKSSDHLLSLKEILKLVFDSMTYHVPVSHKDPNLTLLLSLHSPSLEIRISALQQYANTVPAYEDTTPDLKGISEAVCQLLMDTNINIISIVWTEQVLYRIARHVDPNMLFEACFDAYQHWCDIYTINPTLATPALICLYTGLFSTPVMLSLLPCKKVLKSKSVSVSGQQKLLTIQAHDWLFMVVSTLACGHIQIDSKSLLQHSHSNTNLANNLSCLFQKTDITPNHGITSEQLQSTLMKNKLKRKEKKMKFTRILTRDDYVSDEELDASGDSSYGGGGGIQETILLDMSIPPNQEDLTLSSSSKLRHSTTYIGPKYGSCNNNNSSNNNNPPPPPAITTTATTMTSLSSDSIDHSHDMLIDITSIHTTTSTSNEEQQQLLNHLSSTTQQNTNSNALTLLDTDSIDINDLILKGVAIFCQISPIFNSFPSYYEDLKFSHTRKATTQLFILYSLFPQYYENIRKQNENNTFIMSSTNYIHLLAQCLVHALLKESMFTECTRFLYSINQILHYTILFHKVEALSSDSNAENDITNSPNILKQQQQQHSGSSKQQNILLSIETILDIFMITYDMLALQDSSEATTSSCGIMLSIFIPTLLYTLTAPCPHYKSKIVDSFRGILTSPNATTKLICAIKYDNVTQLKSYINSDDIRMRILVTLLSSSDSQVQSLLDVCLANLFSHDSIHALLQVISSLHYHSPLYDNTDMILTKRMFIRASDPQPFIPYHLSQATKAMIENTHILNPVDRNSTSTSSTLASAVSQQEMKILHVPISARIGALRCIESWCKGVLSQKDMTLYCEENGDIFLTLSVALIHSLQDANESVRQVALNIFKLLSSYKKSKTIVMKSIYFPPKDKNEASNSGNETTFTWNDICTMAHAFTQSSSIILLDNNYVKTTIQTQLLSSLLPSASNAHLSTLTTQLLHVSSYYFIHQSIASLYMTMYEAMSDFNLSYIWSYLSPGINYYLSAESTGTDTHPTRIREQDFFIDILIQSLHHISTATSTIKQDIIHSIVTCLHTTPSTTTSANTNNNGNISTNFVHDDTTSFKRIFLTKLSALFTPEWCAHFNDEAKSNHILFNSLLDAHVLGGHNHIHIGSLLAHIVIDIPYLMDRFTYHVNKLVPEIQAIHEYVTMNDITRLSIDESSDDEPENMMFDRTSRSATSLNSRTSNREKYSHYKTMVTNWLTYSYHLLEVITNAFKSHISAIVNDNTLKVQTCQEMNKVFSSCMELLLSMTETADSIDSNESMSSGAPVSTRTTVYNQMYDFTRTYCLEFATLIVDTYETSLFVELNSNSNVASTTSTTAVTTTSTPNKKTSKAKKVEAGNDKINEVLESISNTTTTLYSLNQLRHNVYQILKTLKLSTTVQSQVATLQFLRIVIKIDPYLTHEIVTSISEVLAYSASMTDTEGKEYLIKQLLQTATTRTTDTTTTTTTTSDPHSSDISQYVIQSLLLYHFKLSPTTRSSLITIILDALGIQVLPACVTTSLSHVLIAYEPDLLSSMTPFSSSDENDETGVIATLKDKDNSPVTILLSIASQKKSQRQLMTSLSEEIFQHTIEYSVTQSFDIQVYNIILLLDIVYYMINTTLDTTKSNDNNDSSKIQSVTSNSDKMQASEASISEGIKPLSQVSLPDKTIMSFNGEMSMQYLHQIHSKFSKVVSDKMSIGNRMDSATSSAMSLSTSTSSSSLSLDLNKMYAHATLKIPPSNHSIMLSILILQYMTTLLQHTTFKELIKYHYKMYGNDSRHQLFQLSFLQVLDKLLQLYGYISTLKITLNSGNTPLNLKNSTSTKSNTMYKVLLGHQVMEISLIQIQSVLSTSCLNIMSSIQSILDIPTFITVFQELLIHQDILVRQKAYEMLSSRLDSLDVSTKNAVAENSLFVDLLSHLTQNIQVLLLRDVDVPQERGLESVESSQRIGLAQSALQCIEILTKHYRKLLLKLKSAHQTIQDNWDTAFFTTLQELLVIFKEFSPYVYHIHNQGGQASPRSLKRNTSLMSMTTKLHEDLVPLSSTDACALLSTGYTVCGALCGVLGGKCLPILSNVMTEMIDVYNKCKDSLITTVSSTTTTTTMPTSMSTKSTNTTTTSSSHLNDKATSSGSNTTTKATGVKKGLKLSLSAAISNHNSYDEYDDEQTMTSTMTVLQAIYTAMKIIYRDVSSFSHPYLHSVLLMTLSTYQVTSTKHTTLLFEDISSTLSTIMSGVAARFALPTLVSLTPTIFELGHTVSLAYMTSLQAYFHQLTRTDILPQLNDVCSIIVLCLDYRRVYDDHTTQSRSVEEQIINTIITISIKLTEVELKALLLRLDEWKDIVPEDNDDDDDDDDNQDEEEKDNIDHDTTAVQNDKTQKRSISRNLSEDTSDMIYTSRKRTHSNMGVDIGESTDSHDYSMTSTTSTSYIAGTTTTSGHTTMTYKQYSRSVMFYHYLSSLGKKLKIIFTPLFLPFWDHVAGLIDTYMTQISTIREVYVQTIEQQKEYNHHKKSKLSSKIVIKKGISQIADNFIIMELREVVENSLQAISDACIYDQEQFMDEQLYETMMTPLSTILSIREAYSTDEDYLHYIESILSPTLVSIMKAMNKDVSWKSMNHKVLLCSRDERVIVRCASMILLKYIFQEMGEDYLGLLPECLPFISELLEDDHEDVVARTNETIRVIEALSGEKLDAYLS